MATATPHPTPQIPAAQQEIRIISHSNLFYWWPVWVCAFIMALITALFGQRLAVVPKGSEFIEATSLKWETKKSTTETETKEFKSPRVFLLVPEGKEKNLAKHKVDKEEKFDQPHLLISRNKNLGPVFCTFLLLVIVITNISLRGLWSVIVLGVIFFLAVIFAILDWWTIILNELSFLDIRINMGGYLFIACVSFFFWVVITFVFDKQIYMTFTPGQFKVRLEIGGGETAYDTAGMTIEKRRNDLFRHLILGFGSGDLIVKTSGAQAHSFDLPNVLALGRRVREIEEMLRQRPVVAGQSR
jgi:hypothetical protein